MPTTANYYQNLKTQLLSAAAAKKAAYDASVQRATTAQFDASGNVSGYTKYDPTTGKKVSDTGGGPGMLDVQYLSQKRNIETAGEASGTLRSGQQARDLADAMVRYKQSIAEMIGNAEAGKTGVDTDTAQTLAKYRATYLPTGTSGNRSNTNSNKNNTGNVGGNTNNNPQNDQTNIPAAPTYTVTRPVRRGGGLPSQRK